MCFSGKNLVDVQGKGLIPMDSLSIGDYVKTADGSFSRVYSFCHIDRKTESVFLQMFATGLAQPLEIFRDHYLYVGRKLVRAGDVKVSDELDERSTFTAIKTVKRRGYYNPLTESGDIVAQRVRASNYVHRLEVSSEMQALASHASLAPLRLICALNFAVCENETCTADGFSNNICHFFSVKQMILRMSPTRQWLLLLCLVPGMVVMLVLEKLFLFPCHRVTVLLGGFLLRKFSSKTPKLSKVKTL